MLREVDALYLKFKFTMQRYSYKKGHKVCTLKLSLCYYYKTLCIIREVEVKSCLLLLNRETDKTILHLPFIYYNQKKRKKHTINSQLTCDSNVCPSALCVGACVCVCCYFELSMFQCACCYFELPMFQEDPAIDYEAIRTTIWCRAVLRDKARQALLHILISPTKNAIFQLQCCLLYSKKICFKNGEFRVEAKK